MKIKDRDPYYGFNHEYVCETMEGDLSFACEATIFEMDKPVAIYHNANPNREKDHKDYMYLVRHVLPHTILDDKPKYQTYVGGITKEEMDEFRYVPARHCLTCDNVIYTLYRHDYQVCECKENHCMIDGGPNSGYVRTSGAGLPGAFDLLRNEFVPTDKVKKYKKKYKLK